MTLVAIVTLPSPALGQTDGDGASENPGREAVQQPSDGEALAVEDDFFDRLTFSGLVAGTYQFQQVSGANEDGGSLTFRPSLDFAATEFDHLHLGFAFAWGNAVNDVTAFQLAPWGADVEGDLRNINGSGRDHLLTAWYRHTFEFAPDHHLALTGGLVDSTEYLDVNAYANDEFTQFMSGGLVNASNGFFPSYDLGVVVEWSWGGWHATGVVMWLSENIDGDPFVFAGGQVGYTVETSIGEGNYRLVVSSSSEDFFDPTGAARERLLSTFLSFDQQFGDVLGGWLRIGIEDGDAAVVYDTLYSGGIDINGGLWGRIQDNVGIGYAYIGGGNLDVASSEVFETYVRFGLTESLALTLDAQHIRDAYRDREPIDGWVFGARCVFEF